MHYIKAISLLVLATIGPVAALFSLLPGPFRSSINTWSKGYINVSCWTITLTILDALSNNFASYSKGPEFSQALLSFVIFIMAFFTPTWTSKLIGGVNLGNVAAGLGTSPAKIGTSLSIGAKGSIAGVKGIRNVFSKKK